MKKDRILKQSPTKIQNSCFRGIYNRKYDLTGTKKVVDKEAQDNFESVLLYNVIILLEIMTLVGIFRLKT